MAAKTSVVVGVFDTRAEAAAAVHGIRDAGFRNHDISILAHRDAEAADAESGAHAVADQWQASPGLLLTAAAMPVPGIGPVLAYGPLGSSLADSAARPADGGLMPALAAAGIPEEEAHYYAEVVRRGGVLVLVHAADQDAERVKDIFDGNRAVDVDDRVARWRKGGWAGHNPGAEPLSADELRRERAFYSKGSDRAYEPELMSDKEREHTGRPEEGTKWPHRKAHDMGEPASLPAEEAGNAARDSNRSGKAAEETLGIDQKPLTDEAGERERAKARRSRIYPHETEG